MTKNQKRQAVEDYELALAIKSATEFTCTILAALRYETARFATLAEARAYKPTLESYANNGRKALVYAVTPNGDRFIPDSFIPAN